MVQPGKVVDMKCLVSPILRLPAFLITLLGTRAIRAVLAENFLLKRQLLILRRSRKGEVQALAQAGLQPRLKRLRWALLKNRKNWTPKERKRMRQLEASGLAAIRAY